MSCGILTAMDDSEYCFSSFKLLYASLRLSNPDLPLTMVDLGMTYEQRKIIQQEMPGVWLMDMTELPGDLPFPPSVTDHRWTSWDKPSFCRASPYQETVWLDVDCICFRPIRGLYTLASSHFIVTEDCARIAFLIAVDILPNKPYTYIEYPVEYRLPNGPFCNTGVMAFHPHRDYDFFDKWIDFTRQCYKDPLLKDSISWWDQGVCQWVIEKYGFANFIVRDIRWNHSAPMELPRKGPEFYDGPLGFLKSIQRHNIIIGHFAGYPKPWGNLTNVPVSKVVDALQPFCGA